MNAILGALFEVIPFLLVLLLVVVAFLGALGLLFDDK